CALHYYGSTSWFAYW
nr:immunoglobulin heavy chain junction region [Mus musculus]